MNLCRVLWSTMANTVTCFFHEFSKVSSLTETHLSLRECHSIQRYCHKVSAFHTSCSGKEQWKEKWITRGKSDRRRGEQLIYDQKICSNESFAFNIFAGVMERPIYLPHRLLSGLECPNLRLSIFNMPPFQRFKSTSAVQPVREDSIQFISVLCLELSISSLTTPTCLRSMCCIMVVVLPCRAISHLQRLQTTHFLEMCKVKCFQTRGLMHVLLRLH